MSACLGRRTLWGVMDMFIILVMVVLCVYKHVGTYTKTTFELRYTNATSIKL